MSQPEGDDDEFSDEAYLLQDRSKDPTGVAEDARNLSYDRPLVRSPRMAGLFTWRFAVVAAFFVTFAAAFLLGKSSINMGRSWWRGGASQLECRPSGLDWKPPPGSRFRNGTTLEKPKGIKIVAVIFFGRRKYVDLLDCYIRKNLVSHGGFLDEVQFLVHTANPSDKEWLVELVKDPEISNIYKIIDVDKDLAVSGLRFKGFPDIWARYISDPDTLYFKIDDDIVFIDDAAIPRMTHTLLAHPEAHSVQANVVNNMHSHWYHYHSGAVRPYLPDYSARAPCNTTWRASDLPCYKGKIPEDEYGSPRDEPKLINHRWLPLKPTPQNLQRTPMGGRLPSPGIIKHRIKPGWASEAQVHMSLLENIEQGQLARYDFGNAEGVWNLWYHRYNINFMAIKGCTVPLVHFWEDDSPLGKKIGDEKALTIFAPKYLEMPVLIDTRAVVAHFAFSGEHNRQRKYLLQTDVLARYRALGNEFACKANHQKIDFNPRHDCQR